MSIDATSAPTSARSRVSVAVLLAAVTALVALLAGCGTGTSGTAASSSYSQIIDVRTPAEYATGHVSGAANIDIRDAGFAAAIAALPKTGTYLVYCHSGNRAGQAVEAMHAIGLTVTSGGGLTDMQSAGYTFVQ
jgi:phage shock protein E